MLFQANYPKAIISATVLAVSLSASGILQAQNTASPEESKAVSSPSTKQAATETKAEKTANNGGAESPSPEPAPSTAEAKTSAATPQASAKPKVKKNTKKSTEATAGKPVPKAENINLEEVITELKPSEEKSAPEKSEEEAASTGETKTPDEKNNTSSEPTKSADTPAQGTDVSSQSADTEPPETVNSKIILGVEVPPNTKTRLVWSPEEKLSGLAERTPVLVVNGAHAGQTLCLTAALHGDELNGIEMIRRVMYNLDPGELTGTVVGVPVVNLMGFRRNSRYLPDRRDLNRYFPGNTSGSSASRIAYSLFHEIILKCDALVDLHTGSFHRTNLTQLRADLSVPAVSDLAHQFGAIAVMNSRGNYGSLRAAAVRAGVPTVTIEAGEPMRLQNDVVAEGVKAIRTLITNLGMYGSASRWFKSAPVYYKSYWVRADQSGILFSKISLGERVSPGEVLGTVTDPITNARSEIISPYHGRILGMALDQVVMPGFAAYHIGIQTPEERLKEENPQVTDDDGDDAVTPPMPESAPSQEAPKDRDDFED
ncbi:N-alpha-acetyl-L-2,4-diaminobutyric acid deacetylase [Thalassocella blandensis]|nr:N-alpha-acetyl-L-2,4-diaminobutyric acid deacetylase [Thalassocella blandensis]